MIPSLIAEVGGNHEGDFTYAKTLCELASKTRADCVKLQLYRASSLVNPVYSPDRYKHFARFELTKDQYQYLASSVVDSGKEFMASVWDVDMLDWIDPYVSRYKIGSGDLTAYLLIKELSLRGKPILLSTGLSTLEEVKNTVNYIYSVNPVYMKRNMLTILQCTSMYPIAYQDANLNVMRTFDEVFPHPYGYSDHTEGSEALELASALGASVLEFHFTDSRDGKTFRDHKVSLTPHEVNLLASKIRRYSTLLGSFTKEPQLIELDNDHLRTFRRALYPRTNLRKGHVLCEADLVELRPVEGCPANNLDQLIGMTLTTDVTALNSFLPSDIE